MSAHGDQGKNFEARIVKEICQLFGIKKTRTTPYHPQSDGLVERFNRTLIDMLSMAVKDDEQHWDLHLPSLLFAYRTSTQATTGTTPFELMFGRNARLPEDVLFPIPAATECPDKYADVVRRRLQLAYGQVQQHTKRRLQQQKAIYDLTAQGKPYCVNDYVLLHNPVVPRGASRKLHRPWQGPFKVIEVLGKSVYRIMDCTNPKRRKVVHFNRLKPAPSTDNPGEDELIIVHNRHQDHQQPTQLEARPQDPEGHQAHEEVPNPGPPADAHPEPAPVEEQPLRRSSRMRRAPLRYGDPISIPDELEGVLDSEMECGDTHFFFRGE